MGLNRRGESEAVVISGVSRTRSNDGEAPRNRKLLPQTLFYDPWHAHVHPRWIDARWEKSRQLVANRDHGRLQKQNGRAQESLDTILSPAPAVSW